MPFSIQVERALDRPDTQALKWGPVLLQTVGKPGNEGYWQLSLYQHLKLDSDYQHAAIKLTNETLNGDPVYSAVSTSNDSLTVRPYYVSDAQPVSSYFRRVEPTVLFGSIDTGVPNRKRNNGLPRYDVPVANITSPGTDGPTFLNIV
ncbi:uncharacterized protein EKO05_0001824 [Ascochyta rabiei]|uniref:uncharacterized protein n=1 Tax=Didymella rabiei TaxID=5454 RepID=UPI002200A9A8|nr:uncharacterized protein EKO05_0001824 [Ascochyta rabiei]UPX11204.1 hypothetical protein EKO05_0001824 [Ascochyta rabiei]